MTDEFEQSITKKYRDKLWSKFVKAIKEYQLIQPNDHVCVCISGGKDSMLMARLFMQLKKHSDFNFEVEYLVMNPGYNEINLQTIMNNLQKLSIPAKVDGYTETYRKFNSIYLLNFISCICVSTLIFELIIPLCNKRHKTIGMMIFKSNLVNRDNIVASNSKILLRFLFIQIIELIAVYLLINWIGILFETLITLVLISFTGNRYALHDLVTNLHVEEQSKSFTE